MVKTKIYILDEHDPDFDIINECAEVIRSGGLVVFPTETVYGIGTNALDEAACKRIYEAKNRPAGKPLLCHMYDIEQCEEIAYLDDRARFLIAKYTPGPLTVIVKKKPVIGNTVTANNDTVGLRIPANNIGRLLLKAANIPVAATSANISSQASSTDGKEAIEALYGRADIIIDSGVTGIGIESTIISLAKSKPQIIRRGVLSDKDLENIMNYK